MDPDLKEVADAVYGNANAAAALMRLAAKSGNSVMQIQVLNYTAERLVANQDVRGSAFVNGTPPVDASTCEGEDDTDNMIANLEAELAFDPDRGGDPDAVTHVPHHGGDPDAVTHHVPHHVTHHGGDPDAVNPRTNKERMIRYLSKPTKMRETFVRFYEVFDVDDVPRKALGEFLSREKNLIMKSSANKLFFPPKGFSSPLFERSGNNVRLSREWIKAWDALAAADVHK